MKTRRKRADSKPKPRSAERSRLAKSAPRSGVVAPTVRYIVGWREWVSFPELDVPAVKAKIDTGARSSSLHAFDVEPFRRRGAPWVRFQVHPKQRNSKLTVYAETPVLEHRSVRSSNGHLSQRPVIVTPIELFGESWEIELTLANRDEMGFRMLLGRQALRGRALIDPARSYVAGKPAK